MSKIRLLIEVSLHSHLYMSYGVVAVSLCSVHVVKLNPDIGRHQKCHWQANEHVA